MNTLEDDKSEVDTLLRFKLEWNMIETPQKHDRFLPTNPSIPTPYFGSLAIRVTGSEGSLFRQKESGDRKKMVEHLPRGENKKKKQTLDRRSEENLDAGSEWNALFCSVNNFCLRCPWARCSTADCSDGADWHQTVVVAGSSQALMSAAERVWRALLLPNESARQSFPG